MQVEVKVPQLSESVAEATLLEWKKKEGEAVKRDENLIDIETDKVVLELPAPADGVLSKIVKANGGTVASGDVIATIDTDAKASAATAAPGASAAPPPAGLRPEPARVEPTVAPSASSSAPAAPGAAGAAVASKLMPAARKMAEDNALDPVLLSGSGRGGRVLKGDVIEALAKPAAAPAAKAAAAPTPQRALTQPPPPVNVDQLLANRPEQRVAMSRLRARIAERLVQSQSTAAILTTFNEVNMQPVIDLRKKYGERFEREHGVRLGFMSFFVRASVHALKKYPVVNASIDGTDIVYHGYFDVGIAVSSPRGLVVPILRDADLMSIADIEKKIAELGQKAKDGKLSLEELTGGTFSISNGGVFGSMLSTPIINPPQSAILGVHATKDRAVVEDGQIVVRPMNYLALSYDHRIIDGREAVLALVAMKDALEDPARLLLDL